MDECLIRRWWRRRMYKRDKNLLAAVKALYAGPNSYASYMDLNHLQRNWKPKAPPRLSAMATGMSADVLDARVRNLVLNESQAFLLQESMLARAGLRGRGFIPLPSAARKVWDPSGGLSQTSSALRFLLMLVGFLRRVQVRARDLLELAGSGITPPTGPYVVLMNLAASQAPDTPSDCGIVSWLTKASPLAGRFETVWFSGRFVLANRVVSKTLSLLRNPFPSLGPQATAFGPYFRKALAAAFLDLLCGHWAAAILLLDVIELGYFRLLPPKARAQAYIFTLGDQASRPLWTWAAEQDGAITPLVYYASSYNLFAYGEAPVPPDLRHPALIPNQWGELWFQSNGARDLFLSLLEGPRSAKVVGGFDLIDAGLPLSELPTRAVAVFDVEPTGQLLRTAQAGYLVPHLSEDPVLAFWRCLFDVAQELDIILVHKPKRPNPLVREGRYLALIREMIKAGRYIEVDSRIGPLRLIQALPASVALPFTSVGDLVDPITQRVAYLDSAGTIAAPEVHACGTLVLVGRNELLDWLRTRLGDSTIEDARPIQSL